MKSDEKLFVVSGEILPEAILKTAAAKEMIRRGEVSGTSEAIEKLDLSRSTFYKYRDGISSFYDLGTINMANISMMLQHNPGVLSRVLGVLAQYGCNVLTINQGLPSQGAALVTISIGLDQATSNLETLVNSLDGLEGLADLKIDGINR